jgi:DNA (cytosine-5)-methyltransferase 1
MAGYRVAWASEFVPAAQDTYRLNHPNTFLNCQNIREVTPEQIVEESGIPIGEIDIFDGSPPCASFSVAGSREKHWGHVKEYSDTRERVDDLFFEYVRLLDGLKPKTFVAENVGGLVVGTAKGVFKRVLQEMKASGYQVSARMLNAKYLGVPQSRERLIFVGVRNDLCEQLGVSPAHPCPEQTVFTLKDALEGVEVSEREKEQAGPPQDTVAYGILSRLPKNPRKIRQGSELAGENNWFTLRRLSWGLPCPTVLQGSNQLGMPEEDRYMTVTELKRVVGVPDDFQLTGTPKQQWERLGRMVPPPMMMRVAKTIEEEILCRTR